MGKLELFGEIIGYLKERKKWWLMPIIVFLFFASLKYLFKHDIENLFTQIINSIGFLLIGLAIAVPVLCPNIILSVIIYKILDKSTR